MKLTKGKLTKGLSAAALSVAAGLLFAAPVQAQSQTQALTKVSMSVPSYASYLGFGYVAKDMGFWKDFGLDVDMPLVAGTGAMQAAAAGDTEFGVSSGADMIAATGHHATIITIAQLFDRLNYQIVISKTAADKTGLTVDKSTVIQRAKALKDLNIAVGAVAGPGDTFISLVLKQAGIDQKDVSRPVVNNSPAQDTTLQAGRIDGFSGSAPFTTIAVNGGYGVDWIDGIRDDIPGLTPLVFSVISANPAYCEKNADICHRFLQGVNKAVAFMKSNRDKSLEILKTNLKGVDPTILANDFDRLLSIMPPGLKNDPKAWEMTQDFDFEVGSITAEMKKPKLEGFAYTDAYNQ